MPPFAPLARLTALVVAFFAVWLGAAEAHKTKGWRTVILPLMVVLTLVVVVFAIRTLVAGAQFTLTALSGDLGLSAGP